MSETTSDVDVLFYQLVISLHASAMQQMGKVANPVTGKVERNLKLASNTIDMLDMLQRKTQGNLNEDEARTLERTLYELRLNYVDELEKDRAAAKAGGADGEGPKASAGSKAPAGSDGPKATATGPEQQN